MFNFIKLLLIKDETVKKLCKGIYKGDIKVQVINKRYVSKASFSGLLYNLRLVNKHGATLPVEISAVYSSTLTVRIEGFSKAECKIISAYIQKELYKQSLEAERIKKEQNDLVQSGIKSKLKGML